MSETNQTYEIIRYSEVESTNTVAFDLASNGALHGTVVVSAHQSGGKGRLTREFESPSGGLYMSMVLRPELLIADLPLITLATGVASASAIEKCSDVQVRLKWPNDLYVNGKKIGGILTEGAPYSSQSKSIPFVIVGIGINVNSSVNSFAKPLQNRISSLTVETGRKVDIEKLMIILAEEALDIVEQLQVDRSNVLGAWGARDYLLGKDLQWHAPDGEIISGAGGGLLQNGRYRLTSSEGDDYSVLAGDIELTAINGKQIK